MNEGLLGEIVFMRGGYRHDLRRLLLDDAGNIGNREKRKVFGEVNIIWKKMETFIRHTDWLLFV